MLYIHGDILLTSVSFPVCPSLPLAAAHRPRPNPSAAALPQSQPSSLQLTPSVSPRTPRGCGRRHCGRAFCRRAIDLIAGLQFYGRLRCGRRRPRLRRFDRRHRLCRCGYRNGAKLLVRLCPRRFRIFPFCRCHSICFRGSCGVRWYWGGSFLPCVWR